MQDFDHEINLTGLQCPLPVLKARKRMMSLKYGERLKILATDPAAEIDFPHYCLESGNKLVWSGNHAGVYIFIIQKTHAE